MKKKKLQICTPIGINIKKLYAISMEEFNSGKIELTDDKIITGEKGKIEFSYTINDNTPIHTGN